MKKTKFKSQDYSIDNLPSNRIEVFFDVIRNHWKTLLSIGLFLLLFMIPFLTLEIIDEILSIQLIGMHQSEEIDSLTLSMYLQMTYFIVGIVKTLMLMIFSLGISGSVRLIKKLIWAEGIEFLHDFKVGIQENWRKMMRLFLLVGIVSTVNRTTPYILSQTTTLTELSYTALRSVLTSVSVLLLVPIAAFVFSQIVFYENRVLSMCINSIAFCGKTILTTYGLLAIICIPYAIVNHFCNISVQIIIYSFAVVILLPLILMIWLLYSCCIFDRYVNPTFYPEIIDKGIWRKRDHTIDEPDSE